MQITAANLEKWLEAVEEIACEAGDMVKGMERSRPKVMHKGPADLVTEADLKADAFIVKAIKDLFPDHEILAEESGGNREADILWVIDPIDGTTNYAHGFPVYAVSIGLFVKKESLAGVVYDPNLKELFSAVRGRGATLNGDAIHVSTVESLENALLATGFPYTLRDDPKKIMNDFVNISLRVQGVRRAGAASIDLCAVACGRFDGFWEVGLKPWDTAAGGLIVEEAGGCLSNFSGKAFDHFIPEMTASNSIIHPELLGILNRPID